MPKNSIVVLAPGHHEKDRRVNRSLEILVTLFDSVTVVYEKRWSILKENDVSIRDVLNLKYFYVECIGSNINILKNARQIIAETNDIENATHIYIHDSGLMGLFLIRVLNNSYPDKFIIFDYHDWIPWELFYQINKRINKPFISKYLSSGIGIVLKHLFFKSLKVDLLVGISQGQINWLRNFTGKVTKDTSSFIFPNVRPKIEGLCKANLDSPVSLLWVGEVMDGRDLEQVIRYIDTSSNGIKLHIVGKNRENNNVTDHIKNNGSITYHGGFNNDMDILKKINGEKVIGFFGGWKDQGLGINEIASPNKIYSYINIGIPVIFNSSLKEIISIEEYSAGSSFHDYKSFINGLHEISSNYEKYRNGVIKYKDAIDWEADILTQYQHFISEIVDV